MSIKQQLYNKCLEFVEQRLQTIQNSIQDIQKSLQSETKSSAGDKHETGRAMLQLEREKAGHQLAEIQKLKEVLAKIDIEKKSSIIAVGSVVYTSQSNYFIAVSMGVIKSDNQLFYGISAATPIGKLLLSKKEGDVIQFRNQQFKILEIV